MSTTTIILRDALKQIGINQDTGELRIKGDEIPSDDDYKLTTVDAEYPLVSSYASSVEKWQAGALGVGSASLKVGSQVSIGDTGNIMAYQLNKEPNNFRVNPFYQFTESGKVTEYSVYRLVEGSGFQADSFQGTTNHNAILDSGFYSLGTSGVPDVNILVWKQVFRLGVTIPTMPIRYRVWEGTDREDDTKLIIEMWLPISLWDGKSPGDYVEFYLTSPEGTKTPIQGLESIYYSNQYSSEAAFSLYGAEASIYDGIIGLLFDIIPITLHNPIFLTATDVETLSYIHDPEAHYIADTTENPIVLNVLHGTYNAIHVSDAAKTFNVKNFTINFYNEVPEIIHSVTLNSYNKTYHIIYNENDGIWYYHIEGQGETVAIASDHYSETDFLDRNLLKDSVLTASAMYEGMIRYRSTANASYCEMCMKTAASAYTWVTIKENTW